MRVALGIIPENKVVLNFLLSFGSSLLVHKTSHREGIITIHFVFDTEKERSTTSILTVYYHKNIRLELIFRCLLINAY